MEIGLVLDCYKTCCDSTFSDLVFWDERFNEVRFSNYGKVKNRIKKLKEIRKVISTCIKEHTKAVREYNILKEYIELIERYNKSC